MEYKEIYFLIIRKVNVTDMIIANATYFRRYGQISTALFLFFAFVLIYVFIYISKNYFKIVIHNEISEKEK